MRLGLWVTVLAAAWFGMVSSVAAQDQVWIQVEAHPTQAEATQRAQALSTVLTPLEGYQLGSGWYALAIGPLPAAQAQTALRQLRITRQIPADSYLVDGGAYRGQFWPPFGSAQQVTTSQVEPEVETQVEPAPTPEPADETPAEARRAENLLTREEKQELQSALAWEGFYTSAIDGALGRGSRRAMGDWQEANNYEVTGVLTTKQRRELIGGYREVLASIGMTRHFDDVAGIDVDLPGAMVTFDRYEPPFVHFASTSGDEVQVILISQSGDRVSLGALFDVLQTLSIVPLDGPRQLSRNSFVIEGANSEIQTHVDARLTSDGIKGFMLVWPAGADKRRDLVLAQLKSSFAPRDGVVMPDSYGGGSVPSVDLLSGLEIRRPSVTRSGFYVSEDGAVVTTADAASGCGRITLDNDVEADVVAVEAQNGIAVLAPRQALTPIRHAQLDDLMPRLGSEVAVSGYSFGGRLGAPSLTYGTVAGLTGLQDQPDLRQLDIVVSEGDIGGPVLAASGAVMGLLLPRDETGRVLPDQTNFAVAPEVIRDVLAQNGIGGGAAAPLQSLAPEDLGGLAADMTVLVSCWN